MLRASPKALAFAATVALGALPFVAGSACGGRRGAYVVGAAGLGGDGGGFGDAAANGEASAARDAAASDGDAASNDAAAASVHCLEACDAAQSVGCANDNMQDCLNGCIDLAEQFPMCATLWNAYNECAAAAAKSAWYCDSDGFAKLSGACTSEDNAAQACFRAH